MLKLENSKEWNQSDFAKAQPLDHRIRSSTPKTASSRQRSRERSSGWQANVQLDQQYSEMASRTEDGWRCGVRGGEWWGMRWKWPCKCLEWTRGRVWAHGCGFVRKSLQPSDSRIIRTVEHWRTPNTPTSTPHPEVSRTRTGVVTMCTRACECKALKELSTIHRTRARLAWHGVFYRDRAIRWRRCIEQKIAPNS